MSQHAFVSEQWIHRSSRQLFVREQYLHRASRRLLSVSNSLFLEIMFTFSEQNWIHIQKQTQMQSEHKTQKVDLQHRISVHMVILVDIYTSYSTYEKDICNSINRNYFYGII